jgi:muramoyltetrapeptide carboxypeptidase
MWPPYLKHGDKIAIISPSGNIDEKYIDGATEVLQSWGLHPIVGKHAKDRFGRFAGSKEERLADVQWAFDTKEIKAVLCSRGGYGLVQIIDDIDFTHFELYPKWVIGFSDITVLHLAVAAYDIASLHGIMAKDICLNSESAELLRQSLFGELTDYAIDPHPLNRTGKTHGEIIGGNLSVMCGLCGTHFDVNAAGKILFIEDVGEKPYQVDRYLYNLKLGGTLEQLSGLIVGQFTEYEEDEEMGATLYELIADAVSEYKYPVIFGFPAGHITQNLPLPFGMETQLNVSTTGVSLNFISGKED